MAPLALDSIPIELIEIIVGVLGFQDLCALRLTARSISGKSSNGRFRENFKSKTLHIAKAPLEDFVRFTQPGQVGCLLQQLTLQHYAVPNPGDSDGCFSLLLRGMENLRINTSHSCLVSLSLSLHGIEDSEYEGYDAAAKLFKHAMLALSNSKLPVQMLDIFAKDYPRGCALACGEIMAIVEKTDLSSSFRGCKKLCLTLSHCLRDIDKEWRSPLSFTEAREHTRFICDFVTMFPVLEELDLAWEYQDIDYNDAIEEEEHFFNRIADSCAFPSLKKCTLRNIRTSAAALLLFLHKVQLASLSMEKVRLASGKFESIFHHLSTSMPNLEYLHLHQLVHDTCTAYFNAPSVRRFPPVRNGNNRRNRGPITITRMGADARRLVEITDRYHRADTSAERM